MLARHVELAVGDACCVDPASLCQVVQHLGHSAKLHESTAPLYKFKNGVHHQYTTVCLPNTSSTGLATYIVEANFRDCFCVTHPTPCFATVVEGVPATIVTEKACFHRAVSILSLEMVLSFANQGEDLPPWRTAQALLNPWHLTGGAAATSSSPGGPSSWLCHQPVQ